MKEEGMKKVLYNLLRSDNLRRLCKIASTVSEPPKPFFDQGGTELPVQYNLGRLACHGLGQGERHRSIVVLSESVT